MNVSIPAELQSFVAQEMKTGGYASEADVVRTALEMLRREREEAVAGILEGLADCAAGRLKPLDEAFDELRSEWNRPSSTNLS